MQTLDEDADPIGISAALSLAEHPEARRLVCHALGRFRDPGALDSLLVALNDVDPDVRSAAADAIGKIFGYVERPPLFRRSQVRDSLIARWRIEDSDDVRSTLIQTLALLGDPAVRFVLKSALDADDQRVRGQARWGLSYLDKLSDSSGMPVPGD
jgi:HEAT repeat protein